MSSLEQAAYKLDAYSKKLGETLSFYKMYLVFDLQVLRISGEVTFNNNVTLDHRILREEKFIFKLFLCLYAVFFVFTLC